MAVSLVFELWPTIYPEMEDEMQIIQRWLAFIISLVLLTGVFYIRKIFQFMRRVDEIRREAEKEYWQRLSEPRNRNVNVLRRSCMMA